MRIFFQTHLQVIATTPLDRTMRFFVSADETGNVKEVVCSRGTDTSVKDGQKPELVQSILQKDETTNVKNRIIDMTVYQEKFLIASRLGGLVSVYELFGSSEVPEENYKLLHTYKLPVAQGDKAIALIKDEKSDFIIVAFESSTAYIIFLNKGNFDFEPLAVSIPSRIENKQLSLSAFVANPYEAGVFACGGKDNDLQVIRLYEKKKVFKKQDFQKADMWKPKVLFQAENVEPDHLDLTVPIWISRILFLKDAPKKGYRLVTATRYGHIRIYNTAEDEEPTHSYKVCDKAILTLNFATEEQDEVIISDIHTFVARLSLVKIDSKAHKIISASAGTFFKPSLKLLGKYSEGGNTGAIHGVDVSFEDGIVAFGGLDRYLRVFDIKTRALVLKVYLGTQVSTLCILDSQDGDDEDKKRMVEERDEEEFWKELGDAPGIQKKKRRI